MCLIRKHMTSGKLTSFGSICRQCLFTKMALNRMRTLIKLHKPLMASFSSGSETRFEKSLNEVRLLGRTGGDAKKGGTETHPVVYFSLATHNNYKSAESGELTQKTDWHRVVIFKPSLRESVYNYLQKGQRVYVSGRLSYGEITDSNGETKPTSAIIAEDVIFFQSKT